MKDQDAFTLTLQVRIHIKRALLTSKRGNLPNKQTLNKVTAQLKVAYHLFTQPKITNYKKKLPKLPY